MRNQQPKEHIQRDVVEVQVSDDLTVKVIPHPQFEFLISSKEVALGYGISESTLRQSKHHHQDELNPEEHYVQGVRFSHTLGIKGIQPHQTFFTKAGVIRLGFYIKSERAKLFRDWAEKVILKTLETPKPVKQLPEAKPIQTRLHLNKEKLADILIDVCQISNHKLRMSILNKLTGVA